MGRKIKHMMKCTDNKKEKVWDWNIEYATS